MNIYTRYVSGEHDKQHFTETKPNDGHIKLRPLSGQFDTSLGHTELKPLEFWRDILPKAAFFSAFDPTLFGHVVTMLYRSDSTNKMCAVSLTKFGCSTYENLILDSSSRFWPACQNLTEQHRSSNVRKALAITNLKNFNKLWNNKGSMDINVQWDETNAGSLASAMSIIDKSPEEIGKKLFSLDLLQELEMPALLVDIMYDNCFSDPKATDENNSLVTLLGEQMEQLFDPLLEYSPQAMDYSYTPPSTVTESPFRETQEIEKVIEELFTVQSNFTMDLVSLLQDFIIPLRVHVLSDVSNTTDGAMKVNAVFPPTIDEVTRINCILNNTLKVAVGYGYTEVFKVLASILPFFFKAFARHQANISNFHDRFGKFLKHNRSYAFENQEINSKNYTPKMIENLILGSLFELPKLKLIIKRLYDLVMSEKMKASNFESADLKTPENIDENYKTIIETIDSLGFAEPENTKGSRSSRIFTPSGKLLTELATQWPEELQYGWMHRKVLAIYELKNTMLASNSECENVVLIIFSDHLLFLEALYPKDGESILLLPDVLMNSLINQKPLPTLANFPKLKVKYWCDVKQLLTKSFKGEKGKYLTFVAYGDNCFNLKIPLEKKVSISFSTKSTEGSETTCNSIISHVCKAQILHKSSPFHLFKYEDLDLTSFYSAHDIQNYDNEVLKSPLVILLNLSKEKAVEILQENPQIFIALTLSYLNEHTVQILGFNREGTLEVNEIVSTESLNLSLKEILTSCMNSLFLTSEFTTIMIEANARKVEFLVNSLNPAPIRSPIILEDNLAKEEEKKIPKVIAKTQPKSKIVLTDARKKENHTFVLRFFGRLRSKPQKQTEKSGNSKRRYANIPQTCIPRGKKPAFKKIYKPDPLLQEASTVASTVSQEKEFEVPREKKGLEAFEYPSEVGEEPPRVFSNNTMLSSRYSESVDVVSNFQFPIMKQLEDISEHASDNSSPKPLQRSDNQMGTVRYVPKKTENTQPEILKVLETQKVGVELPVNQVGYARTIVQQKEMKKPRETERSVPRQVKENTEKPLMTDSANPMAVKETKHQSAPVIKSLLYPGGEKPAVVDESKINSVEAENKPEILWAKEVPILNMEAKCLSMKSKETIFSGKAAANALENLNAVGLPSRVYSRYKIYEELPLSIFNSDNEANWTCLTRDSYSNLQSELQAIKLEISERQVSSATSPPNATMQMKPNYQHFETSEDTFSSFEFVSYVQDIPERRMVDNGKLIYDLDHNESHSESALVDSFIKELDRNFSLRVPGLTGSVSHLNSPDLSDSSEEDKEVHQQKEETAGFDRERQDSCATIKLGDIPTAKTMAQEPVPAMVVDSHLASSDEEYFSSHEFSNALDFWGKDGDPEPETWLMTSSSSEKTLMNDHAWPPKKVDSPQPRVTKWDGQASLDLVENYGSMAYLSHILSGEIEI